MAGIGRLFVLAWDSLRMLNDLVSVAACTWGSSQRPGVELDVGIFSASNERSYGTETTVSGHGRNLHQSQPPLFAVDASPLSAEAHEPQLTADLLPLTVCRALDGNSITDIPATGWNALPALQAM